MQDLRERAADRPHSASGGRACFQSLSGRDMSAGQGRRRRPVNWWLRGVFDDFYAERQRWDDDLEAYAKGYPAEATEFINEFPRPQLADFLRAHAYRYLVDALDTAEEVA